jgi:hypothetical protein
VATGTAYYDGMSARTKFTDRKSFRKMTFRALDDSCIIWFDKGPMSIACRHRLWLVADFLKKIVLFFRELYKKLKSVIDNGGIIFQQFFRFRVEIAGHFVDLKFLFAACAAQPYSSA